MKFAIKLCNTENIKRHTLYSEHTKNVKYVNSERKKKHTQKLQFFFIFNVKHEQTKCINKKKSAMFKIV